MKINYTERKGLTSSSKYLNIIGITVPTITRVTYSLTELFSIDFDELCIANICYF